MMEELEREYARLEGCIANGVASLSDLDLIEVERITQNQSRDRLSSMLDAYLRVLTLMTGVRISDAAQLVMPVPEGSDKEQMLNALIASEIRRPELELYKAQELEIDTQLDYWTAGGLPQFSLFIRGGYGRPGLNMLDNSFQPFAIGGIRLVWNISQLYSLGYGKKIVNYSKEQVNSVRETFLFNTNLQVQEQVAEIQRYFKTVEDDERIVELREKIRESTAAGVENGTKNASDLVSEINKENAARKQLIMHQINTDIMKKIRWIYLLPAVAGAVLMTVTSCKDTEGTNDASGTFEATEVMVSSEASGRILALNVHEGGVLAAGQECGLVDTLQLYLQKRQLEAGVAAALSRRRDVETQTAYIREQIEVNRREADRVRNLIAADAANTKQLDDITSAIKLLETQLAATEADIAQNNTIAEAEAASYRAQIAQVEESLRRCRISSPIDGTVLVKYAEAGELTAAGKPLFKIADLSRMNLRAYITASQLTAIKVGQKVRVFADSGEDGVREYEGTVSWISDQSEFTPKTIQTRDERANLVYAIKVSFVNDGYVKIGMYGDLKF